MAAPPPPGARGPPGRYAPGGARPPAPPPQFFVDHKKGEVNELRQLLRAVAMEKDPQRKRDAIKKVIAYMTLGIDVSRLFPEMVMASHTTDLVQKKMIYLYLTTYADQNQELSILAINTLQKDATDDDPSIRGLALRSLCSLRLANMMEYLEPAVRRGMEDPNPYVRKTAVMGVVKLFRIAPSATRESDLIQSLYTMVNDGDPMVSTNAVCALNEILASEGGMKITRPVAVSLLNRIKYFSEWGQCVVLNLLTTYRPAGEAEMYDIMNLLEERLKHSSAAVILGVARCFMELTTNLPQLHAQVLERLKDPLMTLTSTGSSSELAFSVLSHILLLLQHNETSRTVLAGDFKHFFCRYNEPSYVKRVKIEILTHLTDEATVFDICAELAEYVSDVDTEIGKRAVKALGTVGMSLESAATYVTEQLLNFLSPQLLAIGSHLATATVVAMRNLLRKYPEQFEQMKSAVEECLQVVASPSAMTHHLPSASATGGASGGATTSAEAVAALLWIAGEFCEHIPSAPYALEALAQTCSDEHSEASVLLELLCALVKCFFKRPAETKPALGLLLSKLVQDCPEPDVHDRALLYYRLLRHNPEEARRVICGHRSPVTVFAEHEDKGHSARVIREFNTLSVVYSQPSSKFQPQKTDFVPIPFQGTFEDDQPGGGGGPLGDSPENGGHTVSSAFGGLLDGGGGGSAGADVDLLGDSESPGRGPAKPNSAPMGGDDLGLLLGGSPTPAAAAPPASSDADLLFGGDEGGDSLKVPAPSGGGGGLGGAFDFVSGSPALGPTSSASAVGVRRDGLVEGATMDAEDFQASWENLEVGGGLNEKLTGSGRQAVEMEGVDGDSVERWCGEWRLYCMASGATDTHYKLYLYAQSPDTRAFHLVELLVPFGEDWTLSAVIKSQDGARGATAVVERLKAALAPLLI
uniref:Beta-adaptin appendage C-terminal subdomain domain-containing protein n=1 Tax=Chromera velia CCMP2878 TaxID=1169474 RepID=A0A0G4H631_9ALVE|eukprot:Cvel_24752.t1-p1 / transcript=Cvel_24752.t1 / gene=Cvel_24752 / organism=Chromera_velia_CCMP2878 / gene_product=Beta-adaptin-like protein A, putative / transcript_product=Beta-adaptin-like protein A, putative / location=Cvel_scaffold2720:7959-16314(-) / protein_length=923 / sequence_SO=supercontig / SO=protein_coding / is_pseudo=false